MCNHAQVETPVELNPAQQEVLAQLGAPRDERPQFDAVLRHELRRALEDKLGPLTGLLDARDDAKPGDNMFISKHKLARVMGCERQFVTEEADPFQWSVPIARGSVAHKAIELSVHWRREPEPLVLVDESIARLSEGIDGMADWLQEISEVERAELRGDVNDMVVKFLECFPPLKSAWFPSTETGLRVEIHERFILSGKVDLALGRADGGRAGKVLIDLKTGRFSPSHRDDLRFYALLEAIRVGTPPRRLASYYLSEGRFVPEDVTEELLFGTIDRVCDAVERILMLATGQRDPATATGPACRWCIAKADCDEGQRYLSDEEDDPGW